MTSLFSHSSLCDRTEILIAPVNSFLVIVELNRRFFWNLQKLVFLGQKRAFLEGGSACRVCASSSRPDLERRIVSWTALNGFT